MTPVPVVRERNLRNVMGNKPKQTKSASGIVVNSDGKVLVVDQMRTSWSLPKGHIKETEDPIEAAKREIYEESGITRLKFVRELGSYERYKIDKNGEEDRSELKTIIMFLFRTTSSNLKPVDPENPEAQWVEKKKVAELLTHPKDKEFFLRAIKGV